MSRGGLCIKEALQGECIEWGRAFHIGGGAYPFSRKTGIVFIRVCFFSESLPKTGDSRR